MNNYAKECKQEEQCGLFDLLTQFDKGILMGKKLKDLLLLRLSRNAIIMEISSRSFFSSTKCPDVNCLKNVPTNPTEKMQIDAIQSLPLINLGWSLLQQNPELTWSRMYRMLEV